MGRTTLLPITAVHWHPADLLVADKDILAVSATTSPNQLLITVNKGDTIVTVTVQMLARGLTIMLHAFGLDTSMYSLHSLRRGEGAATAAYRTGAAHVNIKRHAMWATEDFWSMHVRPLPPWLGLWWVLQQALCR